MKKITACILSLFAATSIFAQNIDSTIEDLDNDPLTKRIEIFESLVNKAGISGPFSMENKKLIAVKDVPVKNIKAFVYDAVFNQNGQKVPQRIVIFADEERRHILMGSIIDIIDKKDLSEEVLRSLISTDLQLTSLKRIPFLPGTDKERFVTIVVDLGVEQGRNFLSDVIAMRKQITTPIDLALVSNANNELAVGAQAIIVGASGTENFYKYLAEWLQKGKDAPFLDKKELKSNIEVVSSLGKGIFHIDQNTTALIQANVKRLPVIFVTDNGISKIVPFPKNQEELCEIFKCQKQ